jgi:hypothetical protein
MHPNADRVGGASTMEKKSVASATLDVDPSA